MQEMQQLKKEIKEMLKAAKKPYGTVTANLEETIEKSPEVIKRLRAGAKKKPLGPGLKPAAKPMSMKGKKSAIEYIE